MYVDFDADRPTDRQKFANHNGLFFCSGTLRDSVRIYSRDKRKEAVNIIIWSVCIAGFAVYTTAIVLNLGNWKAMTLFLIAGLFGIGGLAMLVLKLVKKFKELQIMNTELRGKMAWYEKITNES